MHTGISKTARSKYATGTVAISEYKMVGETREIAAILIDVSRLYKQFSEPEKIPLFSDPRQRE